MDVLEGQPLGGCHNLGGRIQRRQLHIEANSRPQLLASHLRCEQRIAISSRMTRQRAEGGYSVATAELQRGYPGVARRAELTDEDRGHTWMD